MATKKQSTRDVKVKTRAEQMEDLLKLRTDYRESRKSHQMGELVNPRVLREHRKAIARLMTQLHLPTDNVKTAVKEEK